MTDREEKALDFVTRHYRPGVFDTKKAIERFRGLCKSEKARKPWIFIMALPAAASIAIAVIAFVIAGRPDYVELASADVPMTYTLPDSSVVTLAPRASVKFDQRKFGVRHRDIQMEGKVYFSVAGNERLPFEIFPRNGYIKVIGTEFQVNAENIDSISVLVDKGKVLFSSGAGSDGIILTRGMEAILQDGAGIPDLVSDPDVNEAVWARKTFIFDDMPLESVLNELSVHYGKKLQSSCGGKKLSGVFEAGDLEETVRIIENALEIEISIE